MRAAKSGDRELYAGRIRVQGLLLKVVILFMATGLIVVYLDYTTGEHSLKALQSGWLDTRFSNQSWYLMGVGCLSYASIGIVRGVSRKLGLARLRSKPRN